MRKFIFALLTVLIIGACSPQQSSENNQQESSNTDKEYTEEIDPTDKEYNGDTAEDSKDDIVGDDEETYWEASDFDKKVSVQFSGTSATVHI